MASSWPSKLSDFCNGGGVDCCCFCCCCGFGFLGQWRFPGGCFPLLLLNHGLDEPFLPLAQMESLLQPQLKWNIGIKHSFWLPFGSLERPQPKSSRLPHDLRSCLTFATAAGSIVAAFVVVVVWVSGATAVSWWVFPFVVVGPWPWPTFPPFGSNGVSVAASPRPVAIRGSEGQIDPELSRIRIRSIRSALGEQLVPSDDPSSWKQEKHCNPLNLLTRNIRSSVV